MWDLEEEFETVQASMLRSAECYVPVLMKSGGRAHSPSSFERRKCLEIVVEAVYFVTLLDVGTVWDQIYAAYTMVDLALSQEFPGLPFFFIGREIELHYRGHWGNAVHRLVEIRRDSTKKVCSNYSTLSSKV